MRHTAFLQDRADFLRFVEEAKRTPFLVIAGDYFYNDAAQVVNSATGEGCAVLPGDQLRVLRYNSKTRAGVLEMTPNPHDWQYYRHSSLPTQSCLANYRFTVQATEKADLLFQLWGMSQGKNSFWMNRYPFEESEQ